MFTILQGRCHYLHFIEKETKAQAGCGFPNDTQLNKAMLDLKSSASLQSQSFLKAILLIPSGEPQTAYHGPQKMNCRPLGFQDRNYSSQFLGIGSSTIPSIRPPTMESCCTMCLVISTLWAHNHRFRNYLLCISP